MKKGSFTSKLTHSFFVQSKFYQFRQGLLLYAESHYCRSPHLTGVIPRTTLSGRC